MRQRVVGVMLAGTLLASCGGSSGSSGGTEDKAACQALADAKGSVPDIYGDLYKKDLSGELRTAREDLEKSSAGDEIRPDTFEKAGTVAALCAAQGVVRSG
jgi:hypothetical protein